MSKKIDVEFFAEKSSMKSSEPMFGTMSACRCAALYSPNECTDCDQTLYVCLFSPYLDNSKFRETKIPIV